MLTPEEKTQKLHDLAKAMEEATERFQEAFENLLTPDTRVEFQVNQYQPVRQGTVQGAYGWQEKVYVVPDKRKKPLYLTRYCILRILS